MPVWGYEFIYSGAALLKLHNGTYQAANVVGLDDSSLFGRPVLLSGNIDDIYGENGFIASKLYIWSKSTTKPVSRLI